MSHPANKPTALSYSPAFECSSFTERPQTRYRASRRLWLAVGILEPSPAPDRLEAFAAWAYRLTPNVVVLAEEGLLLELHGSLRLFSGLAAIKQELIAELKRQQWFYRLSSAPTPLAASWLARCRNVDVSQSTLAGAVGSLPLAATGWPEDVQTVLRQMGLRSIADCLRLPRAGFARRIGREYLDDLDRALGKKPDLRVGHIAPEAFHRVVEFAIETSNRTLFREALEDIVAGFAVELRRRQAQIREIELSFRHSRDAATRTRMRFVDPVHERERILNPLLARLERIVLPAPVIALVLETGPLLPLEIDPPALPFDAERRQAVPEFALIEHLRGRFGRRRVHGIASIAEHRPEHAWRRRLDWSESAGSSAFRQERPLWLLPQPLEWKKKGSDPFFFERIESGWWDGQDIRRDYHTVIGADGEKLWVYRDCRTRRWYLHGIFG